MPGLTKVASYSTESLYYKKPSHNTHNTLKTMYRSVSTRNISADTSETSSLPRLPMVHGSRPPPQPGQWSFLHTLLSQDEEEQAEMDMDFGEDTRPTHSTPRGFRLSDSVPKSEEEFDSSVKQKDRGSKQKTARNPAPSKLHPLSSSNTRKSRYSGGKKLERRTSGGDVERKMSDDPQTQVSLSPTQAPTPQVSDKDSKFAIADGHRFGGQKSVTASDNEQISKTGDTVSPWTTCRALPDLEEDQDSEEEHMSDGEGDSETPNAVESPASTVNADAIPRRGLQVPLSRATSTISVTTGLPRRKRPLLLPPIMLPPIHTVKPTPLRFRDSMFSMDGTSRARRTITDEEWEQLKDCRYIRHRPFKPAVSLSV